MKTGTPDFARLDAAESGAVWNTIEALYAAQQAGDTAAVDRCLTETTTMWHSAQPSALRGLGDLDRLRARRVRRAAGDPAPEVRAYTPHTPRITLAGDVAWVLYWLHVDYVPHGGGGRAEEDVRNTAVLRRCGDRWRIAHLHEEVWEGSPAVR